MPSQPAAPVQVDYSQVAQAYMNQLSAGKAAGLSSTNPTGGMGAPTPPQIAQKSLVGQ